MLLLLFAAALPVTAVDAQWQLGGAHTPRWCYDVRQQERRPNLDTLDPVADREQLVAVANACGEPQPRAGLPNAYYYAAWANRILGEGPSMMPEQRPTEEQVVHLRDAERLFGLAVGMSNGAEPLRGGAARIELARVNRLLGRVDVRDYIEADQIVDALVEQAAGQLGRELLYERAMISIARGDNLHSALQDLQVFGTPSATSQPYVALRGPFALATVATHLGNEALAGERSQQATQLALQLYSDAARALDVLVNTRAAFDRGSVGQIYGRMGLLNLRMASYLANSPSQDIRCAPFIDPRALDASERDFSNAMRFNANVLAVHWGRGCAFMARENYSAAVASLRTAVGLLPPLRPNTHPVDSDPPGMEPSRTDAHWQYARALFSVRSYDEAITHFTLAHMGTRDATAISLIRLDIANVYLSRRERALESGDAELARRMSAEAERALSEAITPGQASADALMRRARLRVVLGRNDDAEADFAAAALIAGGHQPEANYELSRIATIERRGADAVTFATRAYLASPGNLLYRHQGCVVRLLFRLTADQGQTYCTAEEVPPETAARYSNVPRYPATLAYEGLFWLREGQRLRGGNQRTAWAQALRAFERGLVIVDRPQPYHNFEDVNLFDVFTYGRRVALHCAGMEVANEALPNDQQAEPARRLFHAYGLQFCER